MAGVGKLLKQAQKMQRGIETLQTQLEAKEIDVTSGGGAVKIKISGAGRFISLTLDPEFLKEEAKFVSDTVLAAVQDAAKQAKDFAGADALVVVAGMDGALPSVVAGLVPVPVIGLPTSIGYGLGGKGLAALLAMLQTCAPGLSVVNIDNGVGAGITAALIANRVAQAREHQSQ